jgi:hypothetical protein
MPRIAHHEPKDRIEDERNKSVARPQQDSLSLSSSLSSLDHSGLRGFGMLQTGPQRLQRQALGLAQSRQQGPGARFLQLEGLERPEPVDDIDHAALAPTSTA